MNQPTQSAPSAAALEYVGFWARVLAALVDSALMLLLIAPILFAFYGPGYFAEGAGTRGPTDWLINFVLPAIAVIVFWHYRQATPGKMLIGARIVDADSGAAPSTGQLIGRYLGYYLSTIPLFLGLLWVAFDGRKQGWHDKLARTVVVRDRRSART